MELFILKIDMDINYILPVNELNFFNIEKSYQNIKLWNNFNSII